MLKVQTLEAQLEKEKKEHQEKPKLELKDGETQTETQTVDIVRQRNSPSERKESMDASPKLASSP